VWQPAPVDVDEDELAMHAKQIVMDFDGSLSTEVAIIKNQQDYNDIVTLGLPLSNDGKTIPSLSGSLCGLIPKGAKNVEVAKDFLKYLIQPQVLNELLKTGLGRNLPAMPAIAKDDPWWLELELKWILRPVTDRAAALHYRPGVRVA
jgi:multiple sugar transport system substrate-binding protein